MNLDSSFSLPSLLSLGFSDEHAAKFKKMASADDLDVTSALELAAAVLGTLDYDARVDYLETENGEPGLEYVDMGDIFARTVFFNHATATWYVGSVGGHIEDSDTEYL